MKNHLYTFLLFLSFSSLLNAVQIEMTEQDINEEEKEITINFELQPDEVVLKQTIKISIDNPDVKLSPPTYVQHATKEYVATFKDSKELFNHSFTLQVTARKNHNQAVSAQLHLSYLPLPEDKIEEKIFSLQWTMPEEAISEDHQIINSIQKPINSSKKSWVENLQNLVNNTQSNWIRLFFAFLLGLLLSLTPCIYPMIPITIGILHRQGKQSLFKNFLGSLCYATGLSTTFATLGLFAAFAGASFGGLLSTPLFVIVLVLLIGYLSLSMIGFYELPMPSFMKGGTDIKSSFGPYLSAYLFGLLSGSIASPCVSPGLALLLTIVATLGNIFAGFLLLFAFGIGMSVPLMIIGTFSSSLQMLPQAGQWMVEVKKALGFVMLATCLYYLNNILPQHLVILCLIAYLFFAAIFYILDAQKSFDEKNKTIKSFIGIILLAIAIFMTYKQFQEPEVTQQSTEHIGVQFLTDYATAFEKAKNENKLLLLDFWAQHCTICKAIDKKIFYKNIVAQELQDSIIFVKIDCTSSSDKQAQTLKKQFSVFAQPAILIIDPKDEKILKRWSSEPYNMSPEEFVYVVKQIE